MNVFLDRLKSSLDIAFVAILHVMSTFLSSIMVHQEACKFQ